MPLQQMLLSFCIGTLIIYAFQALGRTLLVVRKVDKHFWLGITMLAGAGYLLMQLLLSFNFPQNTLLFLHRLKIAILMFTVTGWIFTLFSAYFPESRYPKYFAAFSALILLLIPFNVFLSLPVKRLVVRVLGSDFVFQSGTTGIGYLVLAFYIVFLFSLYPILYFSFAGKIKQSQRWIGAISFSPGILGGINDFAVARGLINNIMVAEYLFFLFLISISIHLFREDAANVRQIAALNEELEDKIKERTRELVKSNRQLKAMATTDILTGLCNRQHFLTILSGEENRVDRYHSKMNSSFSLVFMDLDNFKYYNDTFGHPAGDLILRNFAFHVRMMLRKPDTLARYGGDEFLALLPNTDSEGAVSLAERILEQIRTTNGFEEELQKFIGKRISIPDEKKIGCSIGIVTYNSDGGKHGDALLVAADTAMYEAKTAGKGCVRVWRER